jgi:hypothetical protein
MNSYRGPSDTCRRTIRIASLHGTSTADPTQERHDDARAARAPTRLLAITTAPRPSTVTFEDLEEPRAATGLTVEDERYLKMAGKVLADQAADMVDAWRVLLAEHTHLRG